jgi:site-specific DNA recombinase
MVDSVTVEQGGLAIALNPEAAANGQTSRILVPWSKPPTRVRHELIPPADGPRDDPRAITAETRPNLLATIAKARAYLDDLIAGRVLDIAEIAAREQRSVRSASMLLSLAFLAPDLVKAIVERRLPRGIAGPLLRPVLGEASYGNVVLSCGEGNHAGSRGLPGGAEGIVRRETGKE